mgnify:CR=1 FL=1
METATRTRFALKKAPEIKAFSALNVRRCAAVWQSPPSACVGWSSRIPGSISAGCYWVQRAFRIGRRAVCAAGKYRRRVPCRRAEPPAGSTCTAANRKSSARTRSPRRRPAAGSCRHHSWRTAAGSTGYSVPFGRASGA